MKLIIAIGSCAALAGAGCKNNDAHSRRAEKAIEAASAGASAPPPSFEITAPRVILADEVAPNATYVKNGLGSKAGAGNTFACVELHIKNSGSKPAPAGAPKLAGSDGAQVVLDTSAAGNTPDAWKPGFKPFKAGPIDPGATLDALHCYKVPTTVAQGKLQLVFDEAGWGDTGPFKKTIELPAAQPAPPIND